MPWSAATRTWRSSSGARRSRRTRAPGTRSSTGSTCCTYTTEALGPLRSKADFDHVLWQVSHDNVEVYRDSDGWYLLIRGSCEHLLPGGGCGIYEQRPQVWRSYCIERDQLFARLDEDDALAARYAEAVSGQTSIDCFDAWARELAGTGYLHNHARMWFASIWIFTLDLPWQGLAETGESFHQRHLERYGHRLDLPVELVNQRVQVRGPASRLRLPELAPGGPAAPTGYVALHDIDAPVPRYRRERLVAGQRIAGPALVLERGGLDGGHRVGRGPRSHSVERPGPDVCPAATAG